MLKLCVNAREMLVDPFFLKRKSFQSLHVDSCVRIYIELLSPNERKYSKYIPLKGNSAWILNKYFATQMSNTCVSDIRHRKSKGSYAGLLNDLVSIQRKQFSYIKTIFVIECFLYLSICALFQETNTWWYSQPHDL